MLAVIDYGAGNIRSVCNALRKLGCEPKVTSKPEEVLKAKAVILPGVGAADDTYKSLKELGLAEPIKRVIEDGKPFLGICVGMQVLFESTEEGSGSECLGVIPGRIKLFPPKQKVPHMGWNQVWNDSENPLFRGIPNGSEFYFVHSYYAESSEESFRMSHTDYIVRFISAASKGNLFATQFHPEKSGELGLKVFKNFLEKAGLITD